MQNTIIREFAGHPQVFTAAFQQGGSLGETREWLEVFWRNYYLRDRLIWDPTGVIGLQAYGQPNTHLPFGRGFIIDQEGRVALPYFGHQPQMVIAKIHELLGTAHAAERLGAERPDLAALHIRPNPCGQRLRIACESAVPGRVGLEIFDVEGRRTASLRPRSHLPAGVHHIDWDGLTQAGRRAAPGTYFIRVIGDHGDLRRAVTLIR